MTSAIDGEFGPRLVVVRTPGGDSTAQLNVRKHDRTWSVSLDLNQSTWRGEGHNLFAALRDLRVSLDDERILVGVNGARPNAAVSGMLANMGEGRQVYLLTLPRTSSRPKTVPTLATAPLDEVATVTAQDAFKDRWFG